MEQATERKRQSILRIELQWMQRGARARFHQAEGPYERYETLRDQKAPEFDKTWNWIPLRAVLDATTVELEGISKAFGDKVLMRDFNYIS